jgi:hypothetical protein
VAKRVRLLVSKRPVHDVEANVSVYRVTKRLRNRGKDLKAERAPQPDRRRVGFDNRVELHRPIAVRPRLVQDMAAQSTAHTLTAPCRMDDKPGIRNVRPWARVDGMSVCAPDDAAIVIDGDKRPPGSSRIHPARARASVLAGSQVSVILAVPSCSKISPIAGQSSAFASRITMTPSIAQPARICRSACEPGGFGRSA